MPTFSCNQCGNRVEKKMPPFSCPSCKAKGKWFTKVEGEAPSGGDPASPPGPPKPAGGIGRPSFRPTLSPKPPGPIAPSASPPSPGPTTPETAQPAPTAPARPAPAPSTPVQPAPALETPKPIAPPAPPEAPPAPEPPPEPERLIWSYPESPESGAVPQRNGALVDSDSGKIYACVQNNLIALEETDDSFEIRWEYSTAGPIPGSPTVGPDGNIRVHSADGYLHIVQDDGTRVCDPVQMGEPLGWSSPVVDRNNITWICGYNGGLFKVEADGKKANRPYFRSREKFDCTGLIHNDTLYIGSNNACVHAIPLTETRGKNVWNPLADQGKTGWYINSAPVLGPGPMIVVASRDDHLYAFGLSGDLLWKEEMPGQVLGSPIVHGDGIYLGIGIQSRGQEGRGMLIRIDATTHKVIWRKEVDSPIESTPAISSDDGSIYIGDNAGRVHAVDNSGKPLWKDHLGPPVRSTGAVTAKGRILFGLDDGRLVAVG